MTLITLFFLIFAVFFAGTLSSFFGNLIAHLVIYHRRGRASKSKKDRGGDQRRLIDLIRYD
ncbi:MAG: hypothetical protein E7626_04815 [Ruminococcaceae bacterium]|nr:hypothetical protein [Oscillospiraceae bacterium]